MLFGIRVEVDQLGRLGFDRHALRQLAIDPEGQGDGLGVGGALAWQAEADGVIAVEIDAEGGFDGAAIEAGDGLVAAGALNFDRLGQRIGAMAREAMRCAAVMYFDISSGETVRTSPMLSKP